MLLAVFQQGLRQHLPFVQEKSVFKKELGFTRSIAMSSVQQVIHDLFTLPLLRGRSVISYSLPFCALPHRGATPWPRMMDDFPVYPKTEGELKFEAKQRAAQQA